MKKFTDEGVPSDKKERWTSCCRWVLSTKLYVHYSPLANSAFCTDCCTQVASLGNPTKLNDFFEYCGCNLANVTEDERKKKQKFLPELSNNITHIKSDSVGQKTGTQWTYGTKFYYELDSFIKKMMRISLAIRT